MNRVVTIGLLAALTLNGCFSFIPGAGFSDVTKLAAERIGKQIHWNNGTPEDEAAERAVREALARELTADDAVQIALLNNRKLQAKYEELGIVQADLVRAGLLKNPVFDAQFRFSSVGTGIEMSFIQNFIDTLLIPLRKQIARVAFDVVKFEEVVQGTQRQYNGMQVGAFQLLMAKQQEIDAGKDYVTALRDYWLARTELEQLLSGGLPHGRWISETMQLQESQKLQGG